MGNLVDSGLVMTSGVIGCSFGMGLGATIEKPICRKVKTKNEKNIYTLQYRDAGHRLDEVSGEIRKRKVVKIWVRKSDLLWVGLNTSASFGLISLEPA